MNILKGAGDYFALDVGSNAIRVVQLTGNEKTGWSLLHFGYAPADAKLTAADSPESKNKLGEIIMTAVGQSGISTKNVVVGLPSEKTFTTVVDVPTMSESELESAMRYQTDQYVPIPMDDAKVDWHLLGPSLHDPKQQEVLIASTANSYAEERLEFIEGLGFNVVGLEPAPIAMIRSLLPPASQDAQLIVNMGEHSCDVAITYGGAPRLVRTIPTGFNTLVKASVQTLNVKEDQARQFILKFGLATDRLDGQVYRALENTLDSFVNELSKSVKFFQTRYNSISVNGVLVSGFCVTIPKLAEYIESKASLKVQPANPWQRVRVGQAEQQQLMPIANEFANVVGLAQRNMPL